MNKKTWIIIAIVIALLVGGGIFLYFKNGASSFSNESTYEADKTSANNTSNQTEENDHNMENQPNTNEVTQGITESENTPTPTTTEEQIATFTTKIYSKDSARQNNISITCQTLDGTIVKNGAIFSFCGTVGEASTSKGYQKADIFDKDGNKKKGLGGRKLPN